MSNIAYQTNILLNPDSFHVNFIAMNYDCTNTVLEFDFYTDPGSPHTWKFNASPASSSVQISEPTDTIAVTTGINYACGQRQFTFFDANDPSIVPTWLAIISNSDMTISLIVDTTNEPDTVIGSYNIQVEISLVDYSIVSKVTTTIKIDIVCPDNPISFVKIGGNPQSATNPIVIDTSLGVGAQEIGLLEQYEVQPAACGFPTTFSETFEDITLGTSADSYI